MSSVSYPGSTDVEIDSSDDDVVIVDEEEYQVSKELTDDVMLIKFDEPVVFKLTYDGEPIDDERFHIELNELEVGFE